ncbi:hypothetical protein [Belliella pelovolcani]|uniref:Uncharacterized protein n=1 Tax=Belliella pelovolcani TaxID=529505 RepID=A0A1N7Q3V9_9BACT|nr:hypothetical protein [Belliella pelovolcani]SIT17515.1 hypothetical protein SAMN05421761_1286 [Belliella pelovolcani]
MDGIVYQAIIGGVVSLLLSIIAYFLHLLIQDIRYMKLEQHKLGHLCIKLRSEQEFIRKWLKKVIIKGSETLRKST